MSDWWERRRKRRRLPWFDVFEEFGQLGDMMDEMIRRAFEAPTTRETKGAKVYGPYVYGFSASMGPDGKPVIRQFGNVSPSYRGPQLKEEREPLVDVMEETKDVAVVAELPGVEKDDIRLHAAEDSLTISVDTEKRKYFKELELPARVDPKSTRATYKNGVLEVRLTKREAREEKPEGERISVE